MSKKDLRADAHKVFKAGLAAVDAGEAVTRTLSRESHALVIDSFDSQLRVELGDFDRVFLVGGGKACVSMASAVLRAIGPDIITRGALTVPFGSEPPGFPDSIRVFEATHPLPSASAAEGASLMLEIAGEATERDLIIFLLSGGGSAMLPLPADPVTLEDKVEMTKLLLASGATIDEMNAIRKHISAIKGGQFVKAAHPARVLSLIVSDVIGDRLESIGSGPTAKDTTTFATCLEIIGRYRLNRKAPRTVLKRLKNGALGKFGGPEDIPESLFDRCDNVVVCNNDLALAACEKAARELGYQPLNLGARIFGEAREVAKVMVAIAKSAQIRGVPMKPPCCIVAGGEVTVTVKGDGKGGRNQEFALSAALHLKDTPGICVLSAGTDGIDGDSDAAGAIADGKTFEMGQVEWMDGGDFLARNDSFSYFDRIGDTIMIGRTGTNVMDIRLIMVDRT